MTVGEVAGSSGLRKEFDFQSKSNEKKLEILTNLL